jgi:serine phosphatase RsbU (regulator of sigma subunit)/anti-sigma regulatory factor (Ser/Thr protein kinase)
MAPEGRFSLRQRVLHILPRGGTLPAESWDRRHQGILFLLWAHALVIPIYALTRGYSLSHSLLESFVVPATAVIAGSGGLPRRARTVAAAVGLLSSSAVLVHLSGGLIEMHFHFFVMVAVVSLYQEWLTFLVAVGYVFVHHGVMGAIDPDSVFNHPAAIAHPWTWAGVHALFIAGISVACLVNWRLNESYLAKRRIAEERLREESRVVERLEEVGRMLAADLELDHVVQRVTDVATELTSAHFGAFFYNVLDDSGGSYLLYTLSGVPADAFAGLPMPRATGVFGPTFAGEDPVRLDDVTADARYGQNPPYAGMPTGHPPVRSFLAVPVKSRGTVLGGLFFGHPKPGRFSEADERIAVGIAAHAAVAVQNARLYDAERRALEQEQHARERLAIVAEAGRRLLSSSLDLDAMVGELAAFIVPRVADVCWVDTIDDRGVLRRAAAAGPPEASADYLGIFDDTDPRDHPILRVARTGLSELVLPTDPGFEHLADALQSQATPGIASPAPNSALVVPLTIRDGVLGVMTLMATTPGRHLGLDDLELAGELARRAAAGAENARLFAGQRAAAVTLQHALLPERLPDIPGVQLAARYTPAGSGVEVGGDWYDVLALADGTVGLAMGDVVGKGVRAASLMGQLRNALRAFAWDGHDPAAVLERLNRLVTELGSSDHMATLVYAVLDPEGGELRLASAGHPPPALRHPDGTVTFLEVAPGVPLGALPDSRYTETSVSVEPGSTLLFYTDGVVESRELPLDEGMERLRGWLATGRDGEDLCNVINDAATAERATSDDVALLCVNYQSLDAEMQLSFPARPGTLKPLRGMLRRWLRESGATEEETFEILIATGEACANVVRHAPAREEATLRLQSHRDGELCITIRNRGSWRTQHQSDEGGRGLPIMEELMDAVHITEGPPETVVTMRRALSNRRLTAVPTP